MEKNVIFSEHRVFQFIETSERVLDDLYEYLRDLRAREIYLEEERNEYYKIIRKRKYRNRKKSHKNDDIHANFDTILRQLDDTRKKIRNTKTTIEREKARLREFSRMEE